MTMNATPKFRTITPVEGRKLLGAMTKHQQDRAARIVCDELRALYGRYLGRGCSRVVFDSGPVVFKAPTSRTGVNGNLREVSHYERPETYANLPVAPCSLVWHEAGIPIVVMETVRPVQLGERASLPEWATRVDAQQVGKTQSGEWVVFDAGGFVEKAGYYEGAWKTHPLPRAFAA